MTMPHDCRSFPKLARKFLERRFMLRPLVVGCEALRR
jgi:hypothetical protein